MTSRGTHPPSHQPAAQQQPEEQQQGGSSSTTTTTTTTTTRGSNKKGKSLQDDLIKMVYGYGDEKQPVKESIDLLENMVQEYMEEMCWQAYEVALLGQREVQTGDFIFLIRKDVRRYKRMKDLLEADEELREARDPKVKKLTET